MLLRRSVPLFGLLGCALPWLPHEPEAPPSASEAKAPAEASVRAALGDDFEGSTRGRPELLEGVFHPDLNLDYVRDGTIRTWSGQSYIESTKPGEPTGETGRILWVDVTGDLATAKVEIRGAPSEPSFTDDFLLAESEAGWKIVHKAFTRSGPESGPRDGKAAIREQSRLFSEAYVAGDAASQVAFYDAQAVLSPPSGGTIQGPESIERYWTLPEGTKILEHEALSESLLLDGGLAYDRGTYRGRVSKEGRIRAFRGRYLIVWSRGADGVWRMREDMWNTLPVEEDRR